MKKYIKPEIEIVVVETMSMIAASVGFNATEVNGANAEGHGNDGDDW